MKIDRDLVAGARPDTAVSAPAILVRLCRDMNARVVMEGIETAEELAVARAIEADYCQDTTRPSGLAPPNVAPSLLA